MEKSDFLFFFVFRFSPCLSGSVVKNTPQPFRYGNNSRNAGVPDERSSS